MTYAEDQVERMEGEVEQLDLIIQYHQASIEEAKKCKIEIIEAIDALMQGLDRESHDRRNRDRSPAQTQSTEGV